MGLWLWLCDCVLRSPCCRRRHRGCACLAAAGWCLLRRHCCTSHTPHLRAAALTCPKPGWTALAQVYAVLNNVPGCDAVNEQSPAAGLLMNAIYMLGMLFFAALIGEQQGRAGVGAGVGRGWVEACLGQQRSSPASSVHCVLHACTSDRAHMHGVVLQGHNHVAGCGRAVHGMPLRLRTLQAAAYMWFTT